MAGGKNISEWKRLFNEADTDKSGSISFPEFKALITKENSKLTDSQIEETFKFFDGPKGDKYVSFEEFIKGFEIIFEFIADMKVAFDQFDSDKSGYLDKNEVKKMLLKCGQNFSESEVDHILKEADKSGDGKISFEEFISSCT